jgi:hypothetical protein
MDWTSVGEKLVIGLGMAAIGLASSALTWLFVTVFKLRRDMDAAFRKIRGDDGS